MKANACSSSIQSVRFNSDGFHAPDHPADIPTATKSQEKLAGFRQDALRNASIAMIGCGGIGSNILDNLARKGCGHLEVCDSDHVERGNLGRQKFFSADVGKNKAICGARNAVQHASWPTEIRAWPYWFEDAVTRGFGANPDAVIVGPDRNSARLNVSRHYYNRCPVIIIGIGSKAEHGYVFVQRPDGPCFGCLFPNAVGDKRSPCPGLPAMVDILLATAAMTLTALDAVLMKGRPIQWNYWDIYLSGEVPTQPQVVERLPNCPICSNLSQKGR